MLLCRSSRYWIEIGSKYLVLRDYDGRVELPRAAADPERILVILTDRIGDALNSLYFLSNLRRLFPRAVITYIGPRLGDPQFQKRIIGQYVDQVLISDYLDESTFKTYGADLVFDLNPNSSLFRYQPNRGFRIGHSQRCDVRIPQPFHNMKANDHLNILRLLGKDVKLEYKPIELLPREEPVVRQILPRRPYVVLCPEATARSWMMSDGVVDGLVRYLLARRRDWEVVILGQNINEHGYNYRGADPRVRQLTGAVSLYQAMSVLAEAECVVSVDTGLMHVASYVKRPLLAVFTCGEPHKNAPQGSGGSVVVVRVRGDVPPAVSKRDNQQTFAERAFLRLDHVVEGFERLERTPPTAANDRVLARSTLPWKPGEPDPEPPVQEIV